VTVPVYIGFGSNLGDLIANYATAARKISALSGVASLKSSPLYHSEPLSPHDEPQPWYLNGIFEIATQIPPHTLFYALKRIEKDMGRVQRRKWAPRVVDLDILFYDRLVYRDDIIGIPHGELANRRFVLQPLCDLAPDFIHPEFGFTVRELLNACGDPLRIAPYAEPGQAREA
jgi:2-amino-4-hydroxy-6-hydroxymethyldihydropteridine diphosphokinase